VQGGVGGEHGGGVFGCAKCTFAGSDADAMPATHRRENSMKSKCFWHGE
jgi:hypothetical protein